jgi:hypothetical protein
MVWGLLISSTGIFMTATLRFDSNNLLATNLPFQNSCMHGHGVYRSKEDLTVYVGEFKENRRDGYGVSFTNSKYLHLNLNYLLNVLEERYLGEFKEGKRHGLGTFINIDGVYHTGLFEQDKFVVNYSRLLLLNLSEWSGCLRDSYSSGSDYCNQL